MSAKNTPEKFWSRVRRAGANDCWPWLGARDGGYGQLSYQGKIWRAHRLAWKLTRGSFRNFVLHRCDNPICCNPKHLFLGTQADNNRDRMLKGRDGDHKGMKHGRAVLTDKAVKFIRAKPEFSGADLARRFGVTRTTVSRVRLWKSWTHVNG